MNEHAGDNWVGTLIGFVILGVVLYFRARRGMRERRLRVEWLWIVPLVYFCIAGMLFWRFPPGGWALVFTLLAFAGGCALGWQRGRFTRVLVDPETHEVRQAASPAAILFLVLLIAIRMGARAMAEAGQATFHLDVMAVSDVLIGFAVGLLVMTRVEIYLRARRLLEEARARGGPSA